MSEWQISRYLPDMKQGCQPSHCDVWQYRMRFANNAEYNHGQSMTGKLITLGLGVDGMRKR